MTNVQLPTTVLPTAPGKQRIVVRLKRNNSFNGTYSGSCWTAYLRQWPTVIDRVYFAGVKGVYTVRVPWYVGRFLLG
jgi:hypothetical protein